MLRALPGERMLVSAGVRMPVSGGCADARERHGARVLDPSGGEKPCGEGWDPPEAYICACGPPEAPLDEALCLGA